MTKSSQFSVTSATAVKVVSAAPQYQEVNFHSTQPVFLDSATVTSSTGYLLDKDLNFQFTLEPGQDFYAIASGTTAVLYAIVTVL
jgi:hypothetical protein